MLNSSEYYQNNLEMLNASPLRELVLWLNCKGSGIRHWEYLLVDSKDNRTGRDKPGWQKAEPLQPEAGIQRNEGIKEPGYDRNVTVGEQGTLCDCMWHQEHQTSLTEVHCTLFNFIVSVRGMKCSHKSMKTSSQILSIYYRVTMVTHACNPQCWEVKTGSPWSSMAS